MTLAEITQEELKGEGQGPKDKILGDADGQEVDEGHQ